MKILGKLLTCLVVSLLWLAPSVSPAGTEGLEVTISTDPGLQTTGSILFTVINHSPYPVRVLTWNTPLEGQFAAKSFKVYRNGVPVDYIGRLVKRGMPREADYLTIAPGESVSAVAVLPEAYDMSAAGAYEATFAGLIQYQVIKADPAAQAVQQQKQQQLKQSNRLVLEVTASPKPRAASSKAAYSGCTAGQIATLGQVLAEANRLAKGAVAELRGAEPSKRSSAGRYTAWFGTYTDSRYSTAVSHFTSLTSAVANETVEFRCDCPEQYYAWVYPNDPYRIHLCALFWQAPLTGTDSQAGTVIHEMSHFQVVAGTDDHVYGQNGAYKLAKNNPYLAVTNADNHEYFAENSPELTMGPLLGMNDGFGSGPVHDRLQAVTITDNLSATKEPGEPAHAGNAGGASLWLSWRAPATGPVRISTHGSYVDTLLAVYTGGSVSGLSPVAANDDSGAPGVLQSEVSFPAVAGQTYRVAVDGWGRDVGLIYLTLSTGFGDLTGDGSVGLADAIGGLQLLAGRRTGFPAAAAADINGNGRFDLAEVIFILAHLGD